MGDDQEQVRESCYKVKASRPFNINADINLFIEKFELFCTANKILDKDKRNILLSLMDDQSFAIANRLEFRDRENFEEVKIRIRESSIEWILK